MMPHEHDHSHYFPGGRRPCGCPKTATTAQRLVAAHGRSSAVDPAGVDVAGAGALDGLLVAQGVN